MTSLQPIHPEFHDSIEQRLKEIASRVQISAEKSGRNAADVALVAVVKTVSVEKINKAIDLGIRHLGDNKIQEAESKRAKLNQQDNLTFHFIGGLQSNKVRKAISLFHIIQSLDRIKIAMALNRVAEESGKIISCLVELRRTQDANRSGLPINEANEFIEAIKPLKYLDAKGLMTIAPYPATDSETRDWFKQVRYVFDSNRSYFGINPICSMGMTDDFELAIEEGSTMIRIGRAIFGDRPSTQTRV